VKGQKATEHLAALVQQHQEHLDVRTMPYQGVIDRAIKAHEQLEKVSDDVQKMSVPCVVPDLKEIVTQARDKFDKCRLEVEEYTAAINDVVARETAKIWANKKSWRNARDYIKGQLVRNAVPGSIARHAAAAKQASISDPNTIGISHDFYLLDFPSDLASYGQLGQPVLLQNKESPLYGLMKSYIQTDMDAINKQIENLQQQLLAVKRSHAIGTATATTSLDFDAASSGKIFKIEGDYTKHLVCAMEQNRFDCSPSAAPFAGTPMFVTAVQGSTYVGMMSPDLIQKAGTDFPLFIQKAEHTVFDECPSLVLEPGDTCFIPFGWIGCMVGMQDSDDLLAAKKKGKATKKEDTKFSVVTVVPLFNMHDAYQQPKAVVQRWLADHLNSNAHWPKSLINHESFKAWKADLETATK